jgi:predicted PurR-regulated permease PerM
LLESLQLSTARVRGRKLFGWQALGMPKHVNMTFKRTEHMEVPFGFRDQPGMKGTERSDLLPRSLKRGVRQRRRPRLYWMSDPCAVRARSFHRPHSVILSPAFLSTSPSFLTVVFTLLGLAGYAVYRQMSSMSNELPTYGANIRTKIHDVKRMGSGSSVEQLERTLDQIKGELGTPQPHPGTIAQPMVVSADPVAGFSAIGWLGPLVEPLSTAGFVIVLVLFMLLDREDLRDRVIGLFGHGHVALTTKAIEEASTRVSRQLLLQTVVNLIYGSVAVAGLYVLGVPYALFWGALGAALRFIPYLGPIAAAGGPILLSLAALPGWKRPFEVAGFYVVLELFTNFVLETIWYAGAAGVSQVALLIAVAFWTWLWGPLGLIMATPLTVCLVVIGKHVPGLEVISTLLADVPALTVESSFYQRLLARDPVEAADLIERFITTQSPDTAYDALLIPALNYAERDRLKGRLSPEEEAAVVETTGEMLEMLVDGAAPALSAAAGTQLRVLGYAVDGAPDELALRMLGQLVREMPIALDITSTRLMASELVNRVRAEQYPVVCIADLPPSAASKARYLVKKLRAAVPDLRITVGRWAPLEHSDAGAQTLVEDGASHVASTLLETRSYLAEAAQVATPRSLSSASNAA